MGAMGIMLYPPGLAFMLALLISSVTLLSSTNFLLTSRIWNLRPQAGQILKNSLASLVD